jgi:hypothetical protein
MALLLEQAHNPGDHFPPVRQIVVGVLPSAQLHLVFGIGIAEAAVAAVAAAAAAADIVGFYVAFILVVLPVLVVVR